MSKATWAIEEYDEEDEEIGESLFSELNYKGIPVIQKDDVPDGVVYFISDKNFVIIKTKEIEELTVKERIKKFFRKLLGFLFFDYCTACGEPLEEYGYDMRVRCNNEKCIKFWRNEHENH